MSKKEKDLNTPEEIPEIDSVSDTEQTAAEAPDPLLEELETLKNNLAEQEDKFLRLAAEYDNYRKRSQKEK